MFVNPNNQYDKRNEKSADNQKTDINRSSSKHFSSSPHGFVHRAGEANLAQASVARSNDKL